MSDMADPFSFNTGAVESKYGGAVGLELLAMGESDPAIVVVAADLGVSPITGAFVTKYPHRFIEAGIAENNAMSIAAGLAAGGMKPYVLQMAAFGALKCAEQIRTDMAYTEMPVRILSAWTGLAMGFFGTSHHALEDIAITRAIPGLTVVSPCDDNAARALLRTTADLLGPVFIRLTEGNHYPVYAEPPVVKHGHFITVREGDDATIIATGLGVQLATGAADALAREGINIRVLDALYLKPLDEVAIVDAARTTRAILTVEEHGVIGGLGSAVAEVIARNGIATRLQLHGLPDTRLAVGKPAQLYSHYGLTIEGVIERMRGLL
ncbi:Transketolase, C-terminal section [Pseudomonas sp. 9AZ]|uniref:transketolase family protein n=1 Tax=Pseudomonas sp. 9AZ TaxID=2653168 RepID=UPI0012F41501|nr:transketolase C-terminal domain-containing protein [Pseudomonas sp. 9AZ]VXD04455.1 Transketolase, C-terminal section [Pseudomonas sp. 9AZ]